MHTNITRNPAEYYCVGILMQVITFSYHNALFLTTYQSIINARLYNSALDIHLYLPRHLTVAVEQWVKALAPQAEDRVFKSQPQQPKSLKHTLTAPSLIARQ